MLITVTTAIKYWLVWMFAHLPEKSLVNFNRETEPMGKVTLNVHNLESHHTKDTKFLFGGFALYRVGN
jgi:hypothetical protein